ncbi:hypothetical protein ALC62_03017 [Cyphomyrmex costatus]|uniref:Uncharacterized protein n=1 Tax=Cyphomyrmex costatus TaxID=456900 RepID=A0A151IMA9_9HYME|nr:hypothetical protein ALC62_03017 [Cyphomyrmex costatus]
MTGRLSRDTGPIVELARNAVRRRRGPADPAANAATKMTGCLDPQGRSRRYIGFHEEQCGDLSTNLSQPMATRQSSGTAPYFKMHRGISSVRSTRCHSSRFNRSSAQCSATRERERERGECLSQDRLLVTLVQLVDVQFASSLGSKLRRTAPPPHSPSIADGGLIMELTERLTFDSISNYLAI